MYQLEQHMSTVKLWQLDSSLELEYSLQQDAVLGYMDDFYREEGYRFDPVSQRANVIEFVQSPSFGALFLIVYEGQIAGYAVLAYGFSFEFGGKDGVTG